MPRDPTHTTTLQRVFAKDIRRRLRQVKKTIQKLVVEKNVFGLEPTANVAKEAWKPLTSKKKLKAFRKWLKEQTDAKILTPVAKRGKLPWTAKYVESAYRKGSVRAFVDSKGADLDRPAGFIEGTKAEFLRGAFSQPERLSKVRFLATRSFEALEGVTEDMATQMNTILANGIAQGEGPAAIARQMSASIDGLSRSRAMLIARTEIITAHAEGQLDSFKDLGVEELGVLAEWSTAGDERVCQICAPNEGKTFKLKDARGKIPAHPNCRCAWIPSEQSTRRKARRKVRKKATKKPRKKTKKTAKKVVEAPAVPIPPTVVKTPSVKTAPTPAVEVEAAKDAAEHKLGGEVRFVGSFDDARKIAILETLEDEMDHIIGKMGGPAVKGRVREVVVHSERFATITAADGYFWIDEIHITDLTSIGTRRRLRSTGPGTERPKIGGRWLTGDPTMPLTDVLRHELGHAVQLSPSGVSSFMPGSPAYQLRAEFNALYASKSKEWWAVRVSKYGSTNAKEAFAESFAAFTHPGYVPGSLPPEVEDILRKYINIGKEA
jgi:SPP1 gp7 family putative phage head morphogenesis protein